MAIRPTINGERRLCPSCVATEILLQRSRGTPVKAVASVHYGTTICDKLKKPPGHGVSDGSGARGSRVRGPGAGDGRRHREPARSGGQRRVLLRPRDAEAVARLAPARCIAQRGAGAFAVPPRLVAIRQSDGAGRDVALHRAVRRGQGARHPGRRAAERSVRQLGDLERDPRRGHARGPGRARRGRGALRRRRAHRRHRARRGDRHGPRRRRRLRRHARRAARGRVGRRRHRPLLAFRQRLGRAFGRMDSRLVCPARRRRRRADARRVERHRCAPRRRCRATR